jgi:hypothetical protein
MATCAFSVETFRDSIQSQGRVDGLSQRSLTQKRRLACSELPAWAIIAPLLPLMVGVLLASETILADQARPELSL